MKRFFQNYGRYIFIFVLSFLIYEFFGYGITYGDPIANYGFSYAIANGQVPYLDFNIISTPLFAFLMSIGLHIFDNYLMFILEQSLLVTVTFYFLYQMYGKKIYWILFGFIFIGFYGLLPTYNFCCFAMMSILLYLESKYNEKDYLIGVFIGLCILSKHTIGMFFILPTFIMYFKNYKKILRRVIGVFIPSFIFIIYLVSHGAFYDFINLCFGGLFDFSSNNGNPSTIWFYISIILFVVMLIILVRDRKNIVNWYLIFTFTFVVPLFDICHFALYFGCFLMMVLPYIPKTRYDHYICNLGIILSITISVVNIRLGMMYEPVFMKKIDRFNFTLNSSYSYDMNLKVNRFLNEYDDSLLLSYHKMFYDISNGNKLDYYDVFMYGNFGYDGVNRMIKEIDKMHDKYIIVDMTSYLKEGDDEQFVKEIVEYVFKSCEKVDSKYGFNIYYKK